MPQAVAITATPSQVIPSQAETDNQVIGLWLAGRSAKTQRAYEADARAFLLFCGKSIKAATVGDIQGYAMANADKASATQARKLSAVKSLLSFAHRIGFVAFNVGAVVKLPPIKNTLAERITDEAAVQRLLALTCEGRNGAILKTIYGGGLRISEACGLKWRDLSARDDGGQATVYGKGGKTRVVILSASIWSALMALRDEAVSDAPVFRSRKGGHLDPVQVHRIVKEAAARAGLPAGFSAHWLRHAHASHSIDRGAPIHLVQATLGHSSVATTGRYLHARPTESSGKYLAV
ncbi:tyrosine-type recombinase/integrase [Asaia spathodeae]|uniref:tyrosine-type recombinase/integrase n=1 Tax=Asaia spathodeae TaxID=657016 RepID=UPI002FC3D85B